MKKRRPGNNQNTAYTHSINLKPGFVTACSAVGTYSRGTKIYGPATYV